MVKYIPLFSSSIFVILKYSTSWARKACAWSLEFASGTVRSMPPQPGARVRGEVQDPLLRSRTWTLWLTVQTLRGDQAQSTTRSLSRPRALTKKQRHHFANKGPYSQSYGFSSSHVWMWGLDHKEGWGLKNWYFELWGWRRLLRVPWTARRSNQSILKEINPEYSLEGLMLKLKLQNFGHPMQRTKSLEKTLMLGKIEGRRRWGR